MQRAVKEDDLVDCILVLMNGKIRFQPVPLGIMNWLAGQIKAGKRDGFLLKVDETTYACRDIFFKTMY